MSSLVLGTAQLGFQYGIANRTGQPDQTAADGIIQEAWQHGINTFDTAQGYGESEHVLGRAFFQSGCSGEALVISKIDPRIDHLDISAMNGALDRTIEALRVPRLFGILLHKEEMLLLWDKGLSKILHSFMASGRVLKAGVSVYSPEMALQALNTDGIDIVQLPTNILDRRFENAGVFQLADKKQKQIHIRSVFLQGLLLMSLERVPAKMAFAMPVLRRLEALSNELGLTRQEIALGYLKSELPNAHVIFGAETREQVAENVATWKKEMPRDLSRQLRVLFSNINDKILNPALW